MASTARTCRRSRSCRASSATAVACRAAAIARSARPMRQVMYAFAQWASTNRGSACAAASRASTAPPRQRRNRSRPRSYAARASADVVDTPSPVMSVAFMLSSEQSVGLDRQRRIPGPLSHGTVVERKGVVAELVQQEQVDGGRDAPAAIADDALVLRDAARPELGFGVGQRGEVLRRRIHERRGGDVDAARHATGTTVPARLEALVELRAQRV